MNNIAIVRFLSYEFQCYIHYEIISLLNSKFFAKPVDLKTPGSFADMFVNDEYCRLS